MRLSLLRKVQLGIFAAAGLPSLVGSIALHNFYKNTTDYVAGGSTTTRIMNEAALVQKDFGVLIQDWKNTMLRGHNPEQRAKYSKEFDERVVTLNHDAEVLRKDLPADKHHYIETFKKRLDPLEAAYKKARAEYLNDTIFETDKADAAVKGLDREVLTSITELVDQMAIEDKAAEEKMLANSNQLLWFSSLLSVGIGCAVLLIVSLIFSRIIKTLLEVANNVDQVSSQLTTASSEVSSASQELSQSTTEQAAALEETAASIEEMSSMVKRNAENSKQASDVSSQSKESANKGKNVVEHMINSMNEINGSNERIMNQVNDSNQQMSEIVSVITTIGERTKVINDIVFQTKLLSFNASVEAARAGEHGKGFAVVAEEVGKLAQMSGNAAKEISDMLNNSIQKVESIARDTQSKVEVLIQEGKHKVDEGTQVAQQCGDVLGEIVTDISQVAIMAGDITTATNEQATGVQEISKAMNHLDQATQQNSAVTQQVASSAEALSSQAESLKSIVVTMMKALSGNNQDHSSSKVAAKKIGNKTENHKTENKEAA